MMLSSAADTPLVSRCTGRTSTSVLKAGDEAGCPGGKPPRGIDSRMTSVASRDRSEAENASVERAPLATLCGSTRYVVPSGTLTAANAAIGTGKVPPGTKYGGRSHGEAIWMA